MNKRLKKKSDSLKRKAIHSLLDTILDINGLKQSKAEETGGHPTAFMDFSGHVGMFYLSVHSYGWRPDNRPDFQSSTNALDSREIHEINDMLRKKYL